MIVECEQNDYEQKHITHEMYETLVVKRKKTGELGKNELMHVQKIYSNVLMHTKQQNQNQIKNIYLTIFHLLKN
jgi:hypothetical protein